MTIARRRNTGCVANLPYGIHCICINCGATPTVPHTSMPSPYSTVPQNTASRTRESSKQHGEQHGARQQHGGRNAR